jgi:hypothetical protein
LTGGGKTLVAGARLDRAERVCVRRLQACSNPSFSPARGRSGTSRRRRISYMGNDTWEPDSEDHVIAWTAGRGDGQRR